MLTYPIRVQRRSYRGSDDPIRQAQIAELNRVAGILEDYVNKQIEERKEEHQKYVYSKIAADLGFEVELVRSILFSLAHGDQYFIVHKLRPIPPWYPPEITRPSRGCSSLCKARRRGRKP